MATYKSAGGYQASCGTTCIPCNFAGEEDEDVEVKQTYVSQYESMYITAILQPYLGHKFSDAHSESGELQV